MAASVSTCDSSERSTPRDSSAAVEARQYRDRDHKRPLARAVRFFLGRLACRAIIAGAAARMDVEHPHSQPRRGRAPRAATVFGMSWNFKSRKTRWPCRPGRGRSLSLRREQVAADLEAADVAGTRRRHAEAALPVSSRARRAPGSSGSCSETRRGPRRRDRRCASSCAAACSRRGRRGVSPTRTGRRSSPCRPARRSPREDELDRVARVHDAAHPDDRNRHGLPALVHHPHRDWTNRRPAQPAHAVRQDWLARLDIDGHRQERVHQRDRVGAGVGRRAREARRARDVR